MLTLLQRRRFRRWLASPLRLENRNLLAGDTVAVGPSAPFVEAAESAVLDVSTDSVSAENLGAIASIPGQHQRAIVINELHVNPDVATEAVEFIELHNPSGESVSLGGMYFGAGVEFAFADDTTIPAGGFFTIAEDAESFQRKFGFEPGGEFKGRLSNEGERVTLRTADGLLVDDVDYGLGFPWPTVGDEPGLSLELMHPELDNGLGGSWRASAGTQSIFDAGGYWRFFKGTEEPSVDQIAWRQPDFDDTTWEGGSTPIGRASHVTPVSTRLDDLRRNYSTVYLRKTFVIDDPNTVEGLTLRVSFDDGVNIWINGKHIARTNAASSELPFDAVADASHRIADPKEFVVSDPSSVLVTGQNVIAVQLLNQSLFSSDIYFDAALLNTSLNKPGPTPNARNSVFSRTSGPHLQSVQHAPQQPVSTEDVKVTVVATDRDGVADVYLEYQVVNPGNYIRKTDIEFESSWTSLAMSDDGKNGDARAADSVFTVVLPASLHQHRDLVRYRIGAHDNLGDEVVVPFADDPQPNFAYFVYDGVPDWVGANERDVKETTAFPGDVMNQVATYHLIADKQDVEKSQYNKLFEEVRFRGTMVYDQQVYDHISFRVRGEFSTYVTGKNKWKFFFNRGHEFRARDNYGRPYGQRWRVMNFSAAATPWVPANRGMAGVGEVTSLRLYDLAGNPSPNSNFVHFRVIDDVLETTANQYEGDFWGLYLTVEYPDGRFLKERGLPDGTTYKVEAQGDIKHQGSTQPNALNDFREFVDTTNQVNTEAWWRENVDLDTYYTFRAINRANNYVGLRDHWNHYVYHNPETNRWTVIPWDMDVLYLPEAHSRGDLRLRHALEHDAIKTEYKNRARELQDLLFTTDQVGQLVDEVAGFVNPPAAEATIADVDQFMWNHNPLTESSRQGSFNTQVTRRRTLVSGDHAGLMQWIKDFMSPGPGGGSNPAAFGWNLLDQEARDDAIPETPVVTSVGAPEFSADNLVFESTRFADPQGNDTFAAMEWRLAEITHRDAPAFDPNLPRKYEIQSVWESGATSEFDQLVSIPVGMVVPGHAYRVRVRVQDDTGRWSHWSAPVEFIASPPIRNVVSDSLRVSEFHYHPTAPNVAERLAGHVAEDDFEFIELVNRGSEEISLEGVRLAKIEIDGSAQGVEFDFSGSAVTRLAPGEHVIVVEDLAAFRYRYGDVAGVAGQWSGRLSNRSEMVTLTVGDAQIQQFTYQDHWHPSSDGNGPSLVIVNANADLPTWNQQQGWSPSGMVGGSPGVATGRPGDANGDGIFDSEDLVVVLQAGEFEDSIEGNSTFAEGDWDGDGDFTSEDLVLAFTLGGYHAAPVAASKPVSGSPRPSSYAAAVDQVHAQRDRLNARL